ncbi:2-polyprenyl-3-methyl-6-methoxy-1,4-benzoquinone monooxygenase [Gammaproteobacteria bacterium AH-315-M22]|nr:2-polyprenyl-3-methyl-6-methoxy-1,4-benzoquinone monooxygenase [Gammaproteobacteria bacterium AH-315-M22]
MPCQRHYSRLDQFLCEAGNLLATTSPWRSKAKTPNATRRASPAAEISENSLDEREKKLSAALMRVNHAGEVAAQGLYLGQSLSAKSSTTKQQMRDAAAEEGDHLDWCAQRLSELDSHTSYLNPLWHAGSIMIGLITGQTGDRLSYGFVEETEQQVMKHLQKHLAELPTQDQKSRAILQQMQHDEGEHAAAARASGAEELPNAVKKLMALSAKLMTVSARYI